ncbi:MAG: hypothetical protein HPY57_14075 [Ignavibacteria bacterium]|nr:hypothetical protein [Ignavibacteria bacterium]
MLDEEVVVTSIFADSVLQASPWKSPFKINNFISKLGTPVWFYRSKKIVNHSWNYADEVEMEQKYQMEKRKQKLKRILNGK